LFCFVFFTFTHVCIHCLGHSFWVFFNFCSHKFQFILPILYSVLLIYL
jgi:hypothetical protein